MQATDSAEINQASRDWRFPAVLKGGGIAHKTDAGGVALSSRDGAAFQKATTATPSESFLIKDMIDGGVYELLLGVVFDPAHGYVLTIATGGVMTEILQDRANLLIPASRERVSVGSFL